MVLLLFFEIPHGDRLAKNVKKQYVQVIPRSMLKPNPKVSIGALGLKPFSLV